ncbi:ankyrin repeat-containing protein At5g02620-like [Oryza brachyantha]|uniref:ankyrin repeat-containing protein At5g02620-like n=1 Tax=Oryza brachyantha TaxID=4533 RepID=UPI001ADAACCE|nr:ankyrin repeat-containing protein At5g02620-like [Oryza brachyantha]
MHDRHCRMHPSINLHLHHRSQRRHTKREKGGSVECSLEREMDPRLHKAAVQGSRKMLEELMKKDPKILGSRTPQGNTALHIAAGFGHAAFARAALAASDGELAAATNVDGDTPLHVAARAGQMAVAELLIDAIAKPPCPPEEGPLVMVNKGRNTPLHEAVRQRRSTVALRLLEAEPNCSHMPNNEMQTPLHIAAREGLADVVDKILEKPWVPEKFVSADSVSGTFLHQAVLGGHTRVVDILLRKKEADLIDLTDDAGNTALHFAAQKNDKMMVRMLLKQRAELAHRRNGRQQSALHVAAYYGSTVAATELLRHSPDAAEMLDRDGRNAFHVAVLSGKVDALRCLLKRVRPEEVVNKRDNAGDTPLHLAAKMSRVKSALMLLKDARVDPCLLNGDGHSARSVVEERVAAGEMDAYVVYLWEKLKKYEALRCKNQQLPPVATYQSLRSRRPGSGNDDYFELSVGTYTLVATLIATVTFAATFTMPGGYNQTTGLAIHADRAAFKIFVVSNTVAMCSSIVVVFCFIWAWRDPVKFKLDQLTWGHRLTVVACLAMIVSLMTSVYLTLLPNDRWPAYLVIAIGACTPAVVILILGKEVFYVPL